MRQLRRFLGSALLGLGLATLALAPLPAPAAGGFTPYSETRLLDQVLGGAAWTPPATLYAALSIETPAADGTNFVEPAGCGYARVAVANNGTSFAAATPGAPSSKTTAIAIAFPAATSSCGTVKAWGFYDAPAAGNLLVAGQLTVSKTISSGDTPRFLAGSLTVTQD